MRHRGRRAVAALAFCSLAAGAAVGASPVAGAAGGDEQTIVIAALGPFFDVTTSTESTEWPAAVNARVAALNESGDLGDYTIEVFECDTGLDPNQTEQCARDAVEAGAVASVGFNGTTGTNLLPILEGAGIPAVGTVPVSPAETSSPVSFPLTSGIAGAFEALPIALNDEGAQKQALVITDLGAASAAIEMFVDDSVARQGYTLEESIKVPPDQTDFAPVVASATGDDPEGVSVFIIGEAAATFIRQLRQSGYDGVLASASPFVSPGIIDALGDDAEGIQVPSLLSWQKSKGGKQFRKEMKRYATGESTTDLAANYWLSTWVVGEQLADIISAGETPDAAALLGRMDQLDNFSTQGMTPPISTTGSASAVDSPVPLERFFNPTIVRFEIKDGKLIQLSKKFVDPFEKQ
jgi:branched-chain amino acid transport system substrate-binding protein